MNDVTRMKALPIRRESSLRHRRNTKHSLDIFIIELIFSSSSSKKKLNSPNKSAETIWSFDRRHIHAYEGKNRFLFWTRAFVVLTTTTTTSAAAAVAAAMFVFFFLPDIFLQQQQTDRQADRREEKIRALVFYRPLPRPNSKEKKQTEKEKEKQWWE